jgi:hypothetical protein
MILQLTAFRAIIASLLVALSGAVAFEFGEPTVNYLRGKPEVHLTVFVHGSIFSAFSILNLGRVIKDDLSETDLYVRTISRLRTYDVLQQDQVLQQEGFHPLRTITFDFNDLSAKEQKAAAPHLVPAYIACSNLLESEGVDHVVYTFGHLGLLSGTYRRDVAEDFYDALCAKVSELEQQYLNVKVTIVTHSHGGNVALNLAYWQEQKKRGLEIDNLVMLGCPIQAETAPYAFNPVFKHVYNVYSDGDIVQSADTISTPSRASYRKLFDGRLKIKRPADLNVVKDIRLRVNESKKRIDHANMWLMGISRKACRTLDPLPILVLIPMIVHAADQAQEKRLDCNIISTHQNVSVQIRPHGQREIIAQTNNIHTHAVAWNKAVLKSWSPDYKSRNVIFSFKMRKVISTVVKDWWSGNSVERQPGEACRV